MYKTEDIVRINTMFPLFDNVLGRDDNTSKWRVSFFAKWKDDFFWSGQSEYMQCIPYNEETKHLLGTTDEAPECYKFWKDKPTKFDPTTLKPFDRVLARVDGDDTCCWFADFVSIPATAHNKIPCIMSTKDCNVVVPYNEETEHLVGTTKEAPERYRYWEN